VIASLISCGASNFPLGDSYDPFVCVHDDNSVKHMATHEEQTQLTQAQTQSEQTQTQEMQKQEEPVAPLTQSVEEVISIRVKGKDTVMAEVAFRVRMYSWISFIVEFDAGTG
jgi:hypothetical protein